jgi:hypothetical protein
MFLDESIGDFLLIHLPDERSADKSRSASDDDHDLLLSDVHLNQTSFPDSAFPPDQTLSLLLSFLR